MEKLQQQIIKKGSIKMLNLFKNNKKANIKKQEIFNKKSINLYEIPNGKYAFKATVGMLFSEYNYNSYNVSVPCVQLIKIQIFINNNWVNVESYNDDINIQLGKKLKKLQLKRGDFISFNAFIKEKDIRFSFIETENGSIDLITRYEEYEVLPQSYQDNITLKIIETTYSLHNRLDKHSYTRTLKRKAFDTYIDNLYVNNKATETNNGFHRETKSMYFKSKQLKHVSNVKKLMD